MQCNGLTESDDLAQLLLFGGHLFSNDSDHNWLQRVTLRRDGSWQVKDAIPLSTRGVQYYTATVAKLPAPYTRQFD